MIKTFMQSQAVTKQQLKVLLLPVEHGVWGFWLEPSLLGLLLAPSWAGVSLVVAVLAAILCQQPLIIALRDIRRNKLYSRTYVAATLAGLCGAVALLLLSLSALLVKDIAFLTPFVFVLPFALYQFAARLNNKGRSLAAELSGASTLAALVPSLILIAEQPLSLGVVLGCIILARTLPSIVYVRARLRLKRGEVSRFGSFVSAGIALITVLVLSRVTAVSAWTLIAFTLLLGRVISGLSPWRLNLKAKHIGMLEAVYGFLVVFSVWLGYGGV